MVRTKKNQNNECWICFFKFQSYNKINPKYANYANPPGAIRLEPHGFELLSPTPPVNIDYLDIHSEEKNATDRHVQEISHDRSVSKK